jgi:hypothetical protein
MGVDERIAGGSGRERMGHHYAPGGGLEHDDVLLSEGSEHLVVVDLRRCATLGERREDRPAELELGSGQAASSIAAV